MTKKITQITVTSHDLTIFFFLLFLLSSPLLAYQQFARSCHRHFILRGSRKSNSWYIFVCRVPSIRKISILTACTNFDNFFLSLSLPLSLSERVIYCSHFTCSISITKHEMAAGVFKLFLDESQWIMSSKFRTS